MRTSVLKFAYNVYRAGEMFEDGSEGPEKLLATGETTHVIVDKGLGKSTLPERYCERDTRGVWGAFGASDLSS